MIFPLNKIIKMSLENKGFFVDSLTDGYKAIDAVLNSKYDLYILDVNVLGFDGHKVLEYIRKEDLNVPIIMISAQIDIENIRKSYSLGCSDHIKKPFDFEELYLKIEFLLNHLITETKSQNINLGNGFYFDLIDEKLFKHKHEIELTLKEKHLLTLLVKNLNKVVTNEMIHEYVWDSKEMESVSMRSMIHKLQKKLMSGMIVNIRGVGYKLIKKESF